MGIVVYLALGPRRSRAAASHAARLAGAGEQVHLVVAAGSDWADGEIADGVTVHRMSAVEPAAARREARRFLLGRRSPLTEAGLLVVGDPESTPLAGPARRRFPQLTVALEPTPEPGRRPAPADLAVVTPWYPARGTGPAARVSILHPEDWIHSPKGIAGKLVGVTLDREIARSGGVVVEDRPEGELTRVVVAQPAHHGPTLRAQAQIDRLRAVLPGGRIEAPLVHAHTGHHGLVAAALARTDARIVLTEYASSWAKRPGDAQYRDTLARVDLVLCEPPIREQMVERFPDHAWKIQVVPDSIDYRRLLPDGPAVAAAPSVPAPRVPAQGAERVVVVAIDGGRNARVARYVDGARQKGYAVDLIALNPAKWSQYASDDGVRIFDIGSVEQRRLLRRLERGLITTLPRRALGFARARARSLNSPLPEAVAIHAQRGHHKVARAFDGKIYERAYHLVRPRIIWQITRRAVVPALDLARTRAVVVHGLPGVTTAWGLAQHDPAMEVVTDLTPPTEDAGVRP